MHDLFIAAVRSVVGDAKRVSEFLAVFFPGLARAVGAEFVVIGGVFGAGQVLEEGVEHGKVVDGDGDEGFADGPLASLFGTIGSRLVAGG